MKSKPTPYIIIIFLILFYSCNHRIDSQFRGPERNGIYPETGLLQEWPENGPELLWRIDSLGQGLSSPAVTDDCVFITGMKDTTGFLFCLDLQGNLKWEKEYGPEWNGYWKGPRSTPTVVGNKIYFLSGWGQLVCIDIKKREELWALQFDDFFGVDSVIRYGFSESVLIDGDMLYCTPGGSEHNVVSINRHSGELIWSCPGYGERAAYVSPMIFNHNGRKIISTLTISSILGIDATSGELLWRVEQLPWGTTQVNSPIYENGILFAGSLSWEEPSGLVALKLNQDGSEVEELWRRNDFKNLFSGFLLQDGCIYGTINRKTSLMCYDAATGDSLYSWSRYKDGTLIYADNRFYFLSVFAQVGLCSGNRNGFDLISEFILPVDYKNPYREPYTPPVIKNKRLYLRYLGSLFVYDIEDKG